MLYFKTENVKLLPEKAQIKSEFSTHEEPFLKYGLYCLFFVRYRTIAAKYSQGIQLGFIYKYTNRSCGQMNYKKLFRTREARMKVLNFLRFIPDKYMIQLQYRIKFGRKLNLKDPKRFTEKLQWYKLYYRNPIMKQCVNKYAVRDYVKSKGLQDILVPLYAHYNRVEDIDWENLPDRFVIKTQHDGGGWNVVIVQDKKNLNKEEVIQKLSFSGTKSEKNAVGREWAYYEIPKGIIAEELLTNHENPGAPINDYKIYCFSGVPKYIHVDVDRFIGHKRNFFDVQWNQLDLQSEYPNYPGTIAKPDQLEKMLKIAGILSEDFPFVRVDLYDVNGKVYFGELTFYPSAGYADHHPDEWDYEFGKDFELKPFQS